MRRAARFWLPLILAAQWLSIALAASAAGPGPRFQPQPVRFARGTTYLIASLPVCLAAGDLNGDGRVDLAFFPTWSAKIQVLLGAGDGHFQGNPAGASRPAAPGGGNRFVLADFNGDGILDLAVPEPAFQAVYVCLGRGDGSFGPIRTNAIGQGVLAMAAGDLNADGKADLVVTATGPDRVTVQLRLYGP